MKRRGLQFLAVLPISSADDREDAMRKRTSSLTFKLFMICLAFVLMCVMIISHLSSRFMKEQLTERDQEFVSHILSKVNEYLTLNFSSMQTILFSADSFLKLQPFDEMQLGRHLESLYEMNIQHTSNVYLVKEDYSIIGGRTITRIANQPLAELEEIYQAAKESPLSTKVSSLYYSRFSGWTVTMSRVSRHDPSLVIAVDLNISELEQKLLQIHHKEQIQLYLADYSGSILAHSNGARVRPLSPPRIGDLTMEDIMIANSNVLSVYGDADTEKLVVKLHSPTYNWLLVAVSDGSRLSGILSNIDAHFIQLTMIGLLLSLLTAMMITRYIRRPVFELIKKMRQVEQGRLDVQVATKRNDEFGYLSRTFDRMLQQISDLFNHLDANKELQKKLEIQVLQAQINPHFLYNTLGAISNVVRLGQLDKVDPVIRSLISILEYGIREPSYEISLQEELHNVRDYLVIQNIRYDKQFRLVEMIDPELQDFHVFRMFLQPIVENSIFHGYRGGREQGEIRIKAYESGSCVMVEVIDDGVGISQKKQEGLLLQKDNDGENAAQRNRIGLANIHGRIRLHYGEEYGLSLSGEPGKGTCVRAVFPKTHERGISDEANPLLDCRR
ncbi:sensor histidine kinase [Paenibacillaceae bacterium]|nr:sensor histidine kinase [Paenibacillaceae bacterium]